MTASEILSTYGDEINAAAQQYSVDPNDIAAVIQTESSGDPNAFRAEPKYPPGSYGLMQLLYTTAQSLGYTGTPDGLYDPATNIMLGTQLLSQLQAKYGDDKAAIYSAYNSGSGTAYQTSSQVASNVQRFLDNLSSLASSAAASIEESPGTSAGIVILAVVFLYLLLKRP
jgi:soluble lytic murein transglycosylase-like protein